MISAGLLIRPLAIFGLYPQKYRILGQSAVAVTGTNTTLEEVYATIPIPAGAMGLNGSLRVTSMWSYTNSGNAKTLKHRLGGTLGSTLMSTSGTTTVQFRAQSQTTNRGVANSQISGLNFTATLAAVLATAVDTSVAKDLVISGTKALGSETLTLESYTVELILP